MASTFSDLKFELIGTGDQAGNWGQTTNDNIGTAIEQAITGLGNPVFTTDANLTIGLTDTVTLQTARALVLNVTSTGSLTATRDLVVPTIEKQYIVQNNTTGDQSINVRTLAGTGVTVPSGGRAHLYVDGVNVVSAVSYFNTLSLGSALGISSGGTGQVTRQAAIDALAGAVTAGQYLRGNGTDVVMSAIQAADVPTLNQNTTGTAANVTGVVAVANGGTGTATPSLVAGTNITISGTFPNQTINASGGGGTGDVTGPASSTANGIALFNGTTGKILKDSATTDGVIYGLTVGRGPGAVASNTALGTQALLNNSTGADLTAVGNNALRQNTGSSNTAVGSEAAYTNTSGINNTAVGHTALRSNSTGQNNTAVGYRASYFPTSGSFNTAVGANALYYAFGSSNTALGAFALEGAGSASESTAIGLQALAQAEGTGNTSVGYRSLYGTTSGTYNTGLGWSAGNALTTGSTNTFLGTSSGSLITTGSKNTILGSYNGNQGGVDIRTSSNNIVLSDGDGNPRIRVNSSGNTTLSGTLAATSYSGSGSGLTGVPLATGVTGLLPVANGGTGTATPALVAGSNVTITGTWPNQTIASAGGGGGGGDLLENAQTIAANFTIGAGKNALAVGPVAVSSGVSVTVGSGQKWLILN